MSYNTISTPLFSERCIGKIPSVSLVMLSFVVEEIECASLHVHFV